MFSDPWQRLETENWPFRDPLFELIENVRILPAPGDFFLPGLKRARDGKSVLVRSFRSHAS